ANQFSAAANADDLIGIDDEDGVALPPVLYARLGATAIVTASGAGKLDAWIDFNRNGTFEATEKIANGLALSAGANTISFAVPATAVAGISFARFRISSIGGLGPTDQAADGEVEDYSLPIAKQAVRKIAVVNDPERLGQKLLLVTGTVAADKIVVRPT